MKKSSHPPKKILVVEDSKMISGFLRLQLQEKLGYEVIVASTLALAQSELEKHHNDFFVAILDLHLPDAAEGQVVDVVLDFGIPAIVLTSSIDKQLRAQVLSKGVVDYVLKSNEALLQLIDIIHRLEKNAGVKILIADDSNFLRRVVRTYLQLYGFHVLEAENGSQALRLVQENSNIRLVITDYEMPEMDGFELCTRIREIVDKNTLAIIGISSHEDELLSAKFIKGGANDFLTKPFQREELYCRIVQNLDTLDYIKQINKMNQRMKRDLDAAAKLQQSLLPQKLPQPHGARFASIFEPCDELAGDTYNAFMLDKDHIALYVVDVSGHGVPSALLSVTLARVLTPNFQGSVLLEHAPEQSVAEAGKNIASPATVCTRLNAQFLMDPETAQYFTILYGVLSLETGVFTYCTAGHPGPVHVAPKQQPRVFDPLNTAIGFIPGLEFNEESISLAPGDRLYFYTDGVVEAQNENNEEFSVEGLCSLLQSSQEQAPPEQGLDVSLQNVYKNVTTWNNKKFKDDVTLLALEYSGRK